MDVEMPKPGRYIVAVSGGVDSMVLLDILARQSEVELIVAHVDHGIREDSAEDLNLVRAAADKYGLCCEHISLKLGADVSEETARNERYKFLRSVQKKHKADSIITAHHADDLLETAILNMLRGTGRKGVSALADNTNVLRPLLAVKKDEIKNYARKHGVKWREDSTNSETRYLRNYIRAELVNKFSDNQKQKLIDSIRQTGELNRQIDTLLVKYLQNNSNETGVSRQWFVKLPHDVASEVMAEWLRQNNLRDFDKKTINRLVISAKTSKQDKKQPIIKNASLLITKDRLALDLPER